LVQVAQSIGVPLTADALRAVRPEFRDPLTVNVGNRAAYFVPPPADGGLPGAQLLALLLFSQAYGAVPDSERPHLFAEAAKRVFVERARWLQSDGMSAEMPEDLLSPGHVKALMQGYDPNSATSVEGIDSASAAEGLDRATTGFVVADRDGLAVACELTMNRLFGTGSMIPSTGVIPASTPDGPAGMPLGPVMATSPERGSVDFLAAASGGAPATTASISIFLDTIVLGQSLEAAFVRKRLHHGGMPDEVLYEEGIAEPLVAALTKRGHSVAPAVSLGRVNAVWCPDGLPDDPDSCQARSDPRADGLAIIQAE
jgi:gamma-glutamyltranspeptidase/glutathione hydrolase